MSALTETQEQVLLEISEDGLLAWLTVYPFKEGSLSLEGLHQVLSKQGVCFGVLPDVLKQAIDNGYLERVIVARGEAPVRGRSATFEYLVEESKGPGPQVREDGRVDYRELNLYQNVTVDTPLLRKHPPEQGLPGKKVTGEVIPASKGQDYHLVESRGSKIHPEDKNLLVASRAGKPVRSKRTVRVDDVLEVEEVGLQTGHIHFDGSVIVRQTVMSGFRIHATGDILIHGTVEDAEITAEGNLDIRGAVYGKENTILYSKGDLRALYIQNAQIECYGNLWISDGLFHCDTKVLGTIQIGLDNGKGQLNGGRISGNQSLKARILGSRSETNTLIYMGEDPYIRQQIKDTDHNLRMLKSDLEQLVKSLIYTRTHSPDQTDFIQKLEKKRNQLLQDINLLSDEITQLRESLNLTRHQCFTRVEEQVMPGVKLFFGKAAYEVTRELGRSQFTLVQTPEGERLNWTPL